MDMLLNDLGALGVAVFAVVLINATVAVFRGGGDWARSELISMLVALVLVVVIAASAAWMTLALLPLVGYGVYAFIVAVLVHLGLLIASGAIWRRLGGQPSGTLAG